MSKKMLQLIAALFAMTLLAAACGGGGGADDTETEAAETEATGDASEAETSEPAEDDSPTEDDTAAGGGTGEGGEFKIAYQGPLTGDNAALGINMVNGVELAINELNESGELGDVTLTLERLDSQGSPDQAPPLAQQAASDDSVIAVVGPAFSGETAASGPIYDEAGVPFVTPSATNPDLSANDWTHFFRTVATDATQGPIAAQFITQDLGATKVAVIDDASEYGKGLADIVAESLEEGGAEIVAREGIEAGGTDFSTVVGTVVQAAPEAIFYGGYFSDAGLLRKQLVENGGGEIEFVSDDGTFDGGFIEIAGEEAEGSYVTFPGADPLSADEEFLTAYADTFDGAEPGAFTIEAYQNTLLIGEAIKEVGADREAITEFLREFDGEIFGKQISFAENGDIAAQSFFIYQVEDGAWVQKQSVELES